MSTVKMADFVLYIPLPPNPPSSANYGPTSISKRGMQLRKKKKKLLLKRGMCILFREKS